jgi:hypothetical protein
MTPLIPQDTKSCCKNEPEYRGQQEEEAKWAKNMANVVYAPNRHFFRPPEDMGNNVNR